MGGLPADAGGVDTIVLGRPPLAAGTALPRAAISAARREMGIAAIRLRPPGGFHVVRVHRLGPQRAGTGRIRRQVRRAILGGAVVELTAAAEASRLIDVVLLDAGVTDPSGLRVSSGGAVVVIGRDLDGRGVLVRLASEGGEADPAIAAGALDALGAGVSPRIPRLLRRGVLSGVSWTVETLLEGRRPDRLDPRVGREAATLLARFPRAEGPPTALAEDLAAIARLAPSRASTLRQLVETFARPDLPGVLRHGDLWVGNLLVRRGSLTGMIDWDAWHARGVPGVDLLELFASAERLRARRPLGAVWLERPWRSPGFAAFSHTYGKEFGLDPRAEEWEIVGVAWWAAKVAGTLRRLPERAHDERWLADIVDPVLARLA
jgi:hypothetical protein